MPEVRWRKSQTFPYHILYKYKVRRKGTGAGAGARFKTWHIYYIIIIDGGKWPTRSGSGEDRERGHRDAARVEHFGALGNKMAAMRQEMVDLEDLEGLRSREGLRPLPLLSPDSVAPAKFENTGP